MPLKSAEEMGIDLSDNTPPVEDVPQQAESSFALASTEPRPEHQPKGDPVPLEAPKPQSRRERAVADQVARELAAEREKLRQEIAERDARHARDMEEIRQAIARQPPPAQQQVQQPMAPQGPDPSQLRREAKKAIDNRDFEEYERLNRQADAIERDQAIAKAVAEVRQQAQPQPAMDPQVIAMMAAHPRVAAAGPRGIALLNAKDMELRVLGVPPHEIMAKTFKAVDELLGGQQQVADAGRPQFSQANASTLTGVKPGNAPAAPSGDPVKGVQLSDWERTVMKRFKMSEAEYAEHLAKTHPERVTRR